MLMSCILTGCCLIYGEGGIVKRWKQLAGFGAEIRCVRVFFHVVCQASDSFRLRESAQVNTKCMLVRARYIVEENIHACLTIVLGILMKWREGVAGKMRNGLATMLAN